MRTIIALLYFCSCLALSFFAGAQEPDDNRLKKACLSATVQAIDTEIERYQVWLKQTEDPKQKAEFEKEMACLTEDNKKYQSMALDKYELPKKLLLTGRYEGQILFDGQSRSGPFYHVITSATKLKTGEKYAFEIYLVYRRSYPFPNYYVYVVKAEKKE